MAVSPDEVRWAYRLLVAREPESDEVVKNQIAAHETTVSLVNSLVDTIEFRANHRRPHQFDIPKFLIPTPVEGAIRIVEPTLSKPTSQLCTQAQMQEATYKDFCEKVGLDYTTFHRKYWEWAYIYRALENEGMLRPGNRGCGFAVGTEPLPSAFVSAGCTIVASDGPSELGEVWRVSNEYAQGMESLFYSNICDEYIFKQNASFLTVDMLDIPASLKDFDFIWSSCSLEHLGGIEAGLHFVRRAMDCLRQGGIAVHTTEFNLSSNDRTVDDSPTCLFRKKDMERMRASLAEAGFSVREFNFWPGVGQIDSHIDYPPFAPPHLKLALYQFVATSIGFIIVKQ